MIGIFEHDGDNRSGKTFLMALFAYLAHLAGRMVLCNCARDSSRPGGYDCILNFPHYHFDPKNLFRMRLTNCFILIDQAEQFLEARRASKQEILDLGYWFYQVTKAGNEVHYDTVLHKNIEKRIRTNPHWYIGTLRIPKDPNAPVLAIRVEFLSRYWARDQRKIRYLLNPSRFFGIYDHLASMHREELIA